MVLTEDTKIGFFLNRTLFKIKDRNSTFGIFINHFYLYILINSLCYHYKPKEKTEKIVKNYNSKLHKTTLKKIFNYKNHHDNYLRKIG
jgi:hypothetical protein